MKHRPNSIAIWLLVSVVVLVSCTSGSTNESSTTASSVAVTTETSISEATTSTTGDDPLMAQLAWVMDLLNGVEISATEYEAHVDQAFLDAVPYETGLLPVLTELQAGAPYEVVEVDRRTANGLTATIEASDATPLFLILDLDLENLITNLLVQPAELPTLDNPPQTLEEAAAQLGEHGQASLLAAEVVGSECQPIFEVNSQNPVPLGSAFKLFVLGALADAVAASEVSWTDEILITAELKSIPSGILQTEPDGSSVTVRKAAELMISISDNTATDLLINLLGREQVEQAQVAYGQTSPELNIPFLTTREFAVLKVGPGAAELRAEYLAADESGRRQILEGIADVRADTLPIGEFLDPIAPDTIEWFVSLADLCTLHVRLQEKALQPGLEPVAEILSLNPGIPSEAWEYIAFKGGSEPGLVTTSWLVRDSGQRTFVLAATVLDPEQPLEELEAVLIMAAARDLLGE